MSTIIDTAGAAGPDAAGVQISSEQLQAPSPQERANRAAAVMFGAGVVADPQSEPEPEKPKDPPLAEVIRAQREARQAAHQEAQRRASIEQELKAAREELAKARTGSFEDDPVGYAKSRKWTPEQQLLYGQSLLYDLAPDKADPDFRVKMFEDRQRREKAEEARAREEAEKVAATEAQQASIQQFYHDTAAAVRTFEAGSYPESQAWFGEDVDTYMQSLMATARNVSIRAQKEGKVADLSPAALARTLEAETARRMAARDARKQALRPAQPAAAAVRPAGGMQPAETMSTRNMTGAGTPRPPATDEKERIRRAAEVAFRTK